MQERIEIDNSMLTSKPTAGPHPRNKPREYYLFATYIRRDTLGRERRRRDLITLSGRTWREVNAQLVAFCARRNVRIVERGN